jgi:predicted kinase
MNWYKKAQAQEKIMFLTRGLPGSGKSTISKELGKGGVILGSDDFFMVNGKYEFDKEALSYAHWWNQARVEKAMKQGISPIVVDNTNTQAWEAKPYVILAQKYGYKVQIEEFNTPWKFDAEELTKRNTHGVPREIIDKMLQNWQPDITVEDILKSEKPK